MIVLISFIVLLLIFFLSNKFFNNKYKNFSSPGISFPIIGHAYKLATKEFEKDPLNSTLKLYRKHQKNGMMYINSFGRDEMWIGDFKIIKQVLNHPDAIPRVGPTESPIYIITRLVPNLVKIKLEIIC